MAGIRASVLVVYRRLSFGEAPIAFGGCSIDTGQGARPRF